MFIPFVKLNVRVRSSETNCTEVLLCCKALLAYIKACGELWCSLSASNTRVMAVMMVFSCWLTQHWSYHILLGWEIHSKHVSQGHQQYCRKVNNTQCSGVYWVRSQCWSDSWCSESNFFFSLLCDGVWFSHLYSCFFLWSIFLSCWHQRYGRNSKCILAALKTDIVGTGAYISQLMLLLEYKHELTCFLEGKCWVMHTVPPYPRWSVGEV